MKYTLIFVVFMAASLTVIQSQGKNREIPLQSTTYITNFYFTSCDSVCSFSTTPGNGVLLQEIGVRVKKGRVRVLAGKETLDFSRFFVGEWLQNVNTEVLNAYILKGKDKTYFVFSAPIKLQEKNGREYFSWLILQKGNEYYYHRYLSYCNDYRSVYLDQQGLINYQTVNLLHVSGRDHSNSDPGMKIDSFLINQDGMVLLKQ